MPFPSVVDVSHNRLDDPDVLEVFAAMKNIVSLLRMNLSINSVQFI